MHLDLINNVSNGIILAFCLWCVIDLRVHTGFAGTLALSTVGMCAFLNISTPNWFGLIPAQYATAFNVSLALSALWFFMRWKDPREKETILLFDRRNDDGN